MPKTKSAPANVQAPTFIGSYVTDSSIVLTASALASQHALVLGAPGWGKTAVARALAAQLALAADAVAFIRLDPSTPPGHHERAPPRPGAFPVVGVGGTARCDSCRRLRRPLSLALRPLALPY